MGGEQHAVLATFYRRYHAFVVVTADHLNVRTGSGFRFAPLNSATRGARLAYLGMTGNGWVHVALPSDIVGYVARQWVRGTMLPHLPPVARNGKLKPPFVTVLDTRYPARNGPLMHDAAIEPLRRGEKLTYLGTLGSWDKVILPTGRIGWVLNWYLREPRVHINLAPVRRAPRRAPMTGSGEASTGRYVVITGDGLRLRARPRLSAPVIEALTQGSKLGFRGYYTSWVAVVAPDGAQGYVLSRYVRLVGMATPHPTSHIPPQVARPTVPAPAPGASRSTQRGAVAGFEAPFLVVDVRHATLRAGPSLTAPVIVSEPYNTRLALRGIDGPWVHVETRTGVSGWMMRNLTRPDRR
jgi:uncharacterized protein YgiM (DUF1202 family)